MNPVSAISTSTLITVIIVVHSCILKPVMVKEGLEQKIIF